MDIKKDYTSSFLGKFVDVKIDQPMGSKHPKHNYYFSINYGFIPNTLTPDDGEVDAYILGVFKPIDTFHGQCIAVIQRTDDEDDKLIVVPENVSFTDEQIKAITDFQERFFNSNILRP